VGFYLINIGYVKLALRAGNPQHLALAIELVSDKVGLVLLVLDSCTSLTCSYSPVSASARAEAAPACFARHTAGTMTVRKPSPGLLTGIKKSEETRARILQAALTLFRKRGFGSTTMRDIAKEAGTALGAVYYYFDSKDALVMAFYEQTQREVTPLVEDALSTTKGLDDRLRALLGVKFQYYAPNRTLLGALSTHIDPQHPLSPFSSAGRSIRDHDISLFAGALAGSKTRVPDDLKMHLPRRLWLYQMGLLLFWVYDRSPAQEKTKQLFEISLSIVVNLIRISTLPLMRPILPATDLLRSLW
jgi:AcrR family transcriptional regulator